MLRVLNRFWFLTIDFIMMSAPLTIALTKLGRRDNNSPDQTGPTGVLLGAGTRRGELRKISVKNSKHTPVLQSWNEFGQPDKRTLQEAITKPEIKARSRGRLLLERVFYLLPSFHEQSASGSGLCLRLHQLLYVVF